MAKRKTKKADPAKPELSDHEKREIASEGLLMAQSAAEIKAGDCAAYSVLTFNRGEVSDEWRQLGVEALGKFANFGWIAYHALGGLNLDWEKAAENIIAKFKAGFPKKSRQKKPKPAKQS